MRRQSKSVMMLILLLLTLVGIGQPSSAAVCDVNNDSVIDRTDISLITAARNKPASFLPGADADGDGLITVLDARKCTLACTYPSCASNTPPVANAGPNQTVFVGVTVQLDGSYCTDANNDPLTYQWALTSTPAGSTAALSDLTSEYPTFVADRAGTYTARLIANDGHVNSTPSYVTITTQNRAPTANAGPDQTAYVTNTVLLSGTGSIDVDGDPLTYNWSFVSRPPASTATLSDPTVVNPSFTLDRPGDYVVQLIVNDGTIDSLADTVTISTLNSKPVANAGPDQTAYVAQTVQLDGTSSSDVDGNPLTFNWLFTAKPAGSSAVLSDPAAVKPTFAVDKFGTYTLQLIVNDGSLGSDPDSVTISTLNSPPVANAGPNQTVTVGSTVLLNGSGSTDVDGDVLTFSWSFTTIPAGSTATLVNPTTVNPTFVADKPGTYVVQLIVNDGTVNSVPATVTISTQNSPPVANAGPNQTVFVNSMVNLDGSGSSDVDGDPLTYQWSFVSKPAGSLTTLINPTAVNPAFLADKPGTYVVQLVVNDGTVNSAPATVTISTQNSPPVANAGPAQTVTTGSTVLLDGSGSSDVDGDPLTYSWSFTTIPAGSAATLANPTTFNPTFVADLAGTYVAQLIVNDVTVNSAPATVTIIATSTPQADIAIAKTVNTLTPSVGQNVIFTVTVTNNGPADATGVEVTELMMNGLAFVSATPSQGSFDSASRVWSVGSLANGASANLQMTATVLESGVYQNGATVTTSTPTDPNPNNNAAGVILSPIFQADISVAKTVNNATPTVGANVVFSISVSNNGPVAATGVVVTDLLPSGYTFVSAAPSQGSYTSGTGVWTVGSLANGSTATLQITATVNASGSYTNTATVTASSPADPNAANNSASAGTAPVGQADIAVTKTVNNATPTVGANIIFTVTAHNNGPSDATGVQVTDLLPSGYTFVSAAPSQGIYTSGTGIWTVGSLANGASATLQITATVNASGSYTNTAAVTASSPADPNAANNSASAGTTPVGQADIAVTKTVNNATPTVGANVIFTITAHNNGPSDATGVVVTDLLPSGYTFVSAAPSQGGYNSSTGVWTVGSLANGVSATLQITATVNASGSYTNTAAVTASSPADPNAANNSASAVVAPVQLPDLTILKTHSANFTQGQPAIYSITVTNSGAGPTSGTVTVTDTLPTGLTATAISGTGWSCTQPAGPCNRSDVLAAGGSYPVITLSVNVASNAPASVTNTATVAGGGESNTVNNTASDPTTIMQLPTITLTVQSNLVGVGRSISGTITLSQAAPAGGVTVNLASSNTSFATVTASVSIPPGTTTGSFTVTGVAAGNVTITGSATGHTSGTTGTIIVTNTIITLGQGLVVAPSQSASLAVSLSTPAPAGGVTINFTSSNTGVATVTASVTVPAGFTIPASNPQVTGVAIGTVQISATASGFAPDTAGVTVTLNASLAPNPLSLVETTTKPITLNLSAPAPAGGLTFNLTTDSAAVATVPATVTVPAGQTSVQITVTGVAVGSTTLRANSSGVAEATAALNVTAAPPLTLNNQTIGKDLQVGAYVYLGTAAPAGNLPVTITSADPTKVLLSTSATAAGGGSMTVTVPAGSTSSLIYIQALDSSGTVQLTASAPGYKSGTATITLNPSGFVNTSGNITTTTFSANTNIYVYAARLNPTTLNFATTQNLRGGLTVDVPVTSSDPTVGTITTSPVSFSGNTGYAATAFHPVAGGSTTVTVGVPAGWFTPNNYRSVTATVSAPKLTLSNQTIGKDLQVGAYVYLEAAAPAGGVQVTVTSADQTRVLLSTSATTAGSGSITVTVPAGSASSLIYIQALADIDTVQLTASAPGYAGGTATITLNPSGFVNTSGNITTTTFSANTNIYVYAARLNPTTLNFATTQNLRGGLTVDVPVTSSDPTVGTITTSPVSFSGNTGYAATAFHPVAGGSTTVTVGVPAGWSTPNNYRSVTATVSAPALTISNQTIGKDLQVGANVYLEAAAPAGGVQVTITSADQTRVLLSTSATTAGSGSITVTVPAGSASSLIYIQALDSSGTVQLTASAAGYAGGTATITLNPSGFVNTSGNITTTTFSADATFYVYAARLNPTTLNFATTQNLRGGLTVDVPVTSSDPTVGTITTSPVSFSGNTGYAATAFHPVAGGSTTVTVGVPAGWSTPNNYRSVTATVSAPALTISNQTIGKDLQVGAYIYLESAPPSPVTVTVLSNSGTIATITKDGTLEGGTSLTFTGITGTTVGPIYIQGRNLGSTTLTVQAPGYSDGTAAITVDPSGFAILSPGNFTTTTASADTPVYLYAARLDPATLNYAVAQYLRGGLAVNVPVTSSDTGVGTITTSPVSFTGNMQYAVTAFNPVAVGTTVISTGTPAGFSTPSNYQQVTATVQ